MGNCVSLPTQLVGLENGVSDIPYERLTDLSEYEYLMKDHQLEPAAQFKRLQILEKAGFEPKKAGRACAQSGDGKVNSRTTCDLSPIHVHFSLVAAITRSWRQGLAIYQPQLLKSTLRSSHPTEKAQVSCHMDAKVIDGRLLVKIEKLLFTGHSSSWVEVPDIVWLLKNQKGLGSCCPHVQWMELAPFVFEPKNRNFEEREKSRCLWSHSKFCKGNWFLRIEAETCYKALRAELSKIWSCQSCCTDMAISYRYLNDGDLRLVTLTAWKDLGRGVSVEDPAWKSHTAAPGASRREFKEGSLYHLFEGKGGKKAPIPYMPNFEEEVLLNVHSTSKLPVSYTTS